MAIEGTQTLRRRRTGRNEPSPSSSLLSLRFVECGSTMKKAVSKLKAATEAARIKMGTNPRDSSKLAPMTGATIKETGTAAALRPMASPRRPGGARAAMMVI